MEATITIGGITFDLMAIETKIEKALPTIEFKPLQMARSTYRLNCALMAFIELDRCNDQRDHLAAFDAKYKIPPAPCWRYGFLLREAEAAMAESLTILHS